MALPAIGWRTLGSCDFIRVPWPAARITTWVTDWFIGWGIEARYGCDRRLSHRSTEPVHELGNAVAWTLGDASCAFDLHLGALHRLDRPRWRDTPEAPAPPRLTARVSRASNDLAERPKCVGSMASSSASGRGLGAEVDGRDDD